MQRKRPGIGYSRMPSEGTLTKNRKSKEPEALFEAFDDAVWPYKSYHPGLFEGNLPRRYFRTVKELVRYVTTSSPRDCDWQRWLTFDQRRGRVELFELSRPRKFFKDFLDE